MFVLRHFFQLFVKNRFALNLMFSGKSLLTPEPRIGKFQICAEMKVNYPTNKENTRMDFSDNFHNIKYFVQVDHIEKNIKISFNFSRFTAPKKPPMFRKISQLVKTNTNTSDYHSRQNLSSNNIEKKESEMSRITKSF